MNKCFAKKVLILLICVTLRHELVVAQLIKIDWYGRRQTVAAPAAVEEDSVHNNISKVATADSESTTTAAAFFYPLSGMQLTSSFGLRYHPVLHVISMHNGIDLKAVYQPVYAFASGTVEKAAWDRRAGFYIVIRHTDNLETVYAHLSYQCVRAGQWVGGGMMIAYSGNTGLSTAPHLHFGVKYKGAFIDPLYILNFLSAMKQ